MSDETPKVACSFCGKNQDQIGKIITGPKPVCICDECIDLCNDIIAEEIDPPEDGESQPPVSTALVNSLVREVVAHYANTDLEADYTSSADGVDWVCDGCGWRLRLKRGAKPPSQHSEQISLGILDGRLRELPQFELVPPCANPDWKRFPQL
jgi:hypothetical protein